MWIKEHRHWYSEIIYEYTTSDAHIQVKRCIKGVCDKQRKFPIAGTIGRKCVCGLLLLGFDAFETHRRYCKQWQIYQSSIITSGEQMLANIKTAQ